MLEADTIIASCGLEYFERTSWSKEHTHKFGGSHDDLATVADCDKFAESFEDNYPEVCDARSQWMIDCRKLNGTDRDKKVEIHVGRNSRIMKSIFGIQKLPRAAQSCKRGNITTPLSQERPDHDLRKRTPQFCCRRRVVVKYVESLRQTFTLRFNDAAVRTRCLEGHMRQEVYGMQKAVFENISNTPRLRSCRMCTTCCSDRFGDRALEVTTTGKPQPES